MRSNATKHDKVLARAKEALSAAESALATQRPKSSTWHELAYECDGLRDFINDRRGERARALASKKKPPVEYIYSNVK